MEDITKIFFEEIKISKFKVFLFYILTLTFWITYPSRCFYYLIKFKKKH